LAAIVDKVVAETLRELEISRDPTDESPIEGPPEIDWLDRYRQTPRFVPTGYRLQKASRKTQHRLGGSPRAGSPPCGACGMPLVLFADLDATDRRLRGNYGLKRLPLYYCCSCPGPVYYLIRPNGNVEVVKSKPDIYEEAPFENPPRSLQPGYLTLKPISAGAETSIFKSVKSVKLDQFKSLSKSQLAEISKILGRKPRGPWDLYFSQIGGAPLSFQGEEGKPDHCPNRNCEFRRRKREEFQFRLLAVLDLWNDKFWLIKPLDAVQIVYHICPGCNCVSAKYTCT
jgi:hypothetical protein